MNKMFMARRVTTIILLIILYGYSAANFYFSLDEVMYGVIENVSDDELTAFEKITNIDSVLNENMYRRMDFIELYGGIQLLLDKNEYDNVEVVKDVDGNLYYSYFAHEKRDITEEAKTVINFVKTMESRVDSDFLFLMPPDKEIVGVTEFPYGIPYPYRNEEADDFLELLNNAGVSTYDYRKTITQSGLDLKDLFYKTDHHWKTETAFWAYTELVNLLNVMYDEDIDPTYEYRDLKNFNQIMYRNEYLGSIGRNTGIVYAGIDDFKFIYPKFETDYTISFVSQYEGYKMMQGSFDNALMNIGALDGNLDVRDVNADKYMSYLYGNLPLVQVQNNLVEDGLKVLFIKDSYMVPVAAFLSTVCSQVDLIDPRFMYHGIEDYILQNNYDYVIISMIPSNLTGEFFDPLKMIRGMDLINNTIELGTEITESE